MKASWPINSFHCGSDNECRNSSSDISGSSRNYNRVARKKNGYDNGFSGDQEKSQVEYGVQVKCEPRGSDEIAEQSHFCEVYPH